MLRAAKAGIADQDLKNTNQAMLIKPAAYTTSVHYI